MLIYFGPSILSFMIDIYVDTGNFALQPHSFIELSTLVLLEEGILRAEMGLHCLDAKDMQKLHQEAFGKDTVTDCISFPIDGELGDNHTRILGDVFVCVDVAKEYAQEHQLPFLEELSLYVIHGILHLLGYDDIEEKKCSEMRSAEKRLMAIARQHNSFISLDR